MRRDPPLPDEPVLLVRDQQMLQLGVDPPDLGVLVAGLADLGDPVQQQAGRVRGAFRLGGLGWPVNVAALSYGIAAIVYIAWPRTPDAAWYANYAVLLSTIVVVVGGLLYVTIGQPFHLVSARKTCHPKAKPPK